ncbi:NfeD family protein [Vibrio alfacsensis]|uniref:NfeD family protein n=1 Tax=Vibrio alfacsensis TaxID=1074311 RepID=UPI004068B1F3
MSLLSLLEGVTFWHWFAFGLALLAVELLGTAGYFLWLGISALIVGLVVSILPISWQLQWLAFATFSLVTTWLWWRRQWTKDRQNDQERDLNQKHKQLIGHIITLEEDFKVGINRLRVADTTWSAQCEHDLPAGTRVEIVSVEGIILVVKPVSR